MLRKRANRLISSPSSPPSMIENDKDECDKLRIVPIDLVDNKNIPDIDRADSSQQT